MLDAYASNPAGALQIAKDLDNPPIYRRICKITKSNGLIVPSRAKTKKRRRA